MRALSTPQQCPPQWWTIAAAGESSATAIFYNILLSRCLDAKCSVLFCNSVKSVFFSHHPYLRGPRLSLSLFCLIANRFVCVSESCRSLFSFFFFSHCTFIFLLLRGSEDAWAWMHAGLLQRASNVCYTRVGIWVSKLQVQTYDRH